MYSDTSNNDSEWPTRESGGPDPLNVSVGVSTGPPGPAPLAGSRVLLVGPGWLGGHIVHRLRALGADVWTLRRTAAPPAGSTAYEEADGGGRPTPDPQRLTGDIALASQNDALIACLPAPLTHVVLCIAPSRSRGDTHASSYPPAARGAVALAARLGARSVLYTSSTGVYGRTDGALVDEDTPLARNDERQRALVDAEEIVLTDAVTAGMGAVVLRVAGLYGPGRDPAGRLMEAAAQGALSDSWGNYAFRDDVASAATHLLADLRFQRGGHVFNCADGHPMRADAVVQGLGVDPTRLSEVSSTTIATRREVARSNQRVVVDRLLATGWTPSMPTVLHGLAQLGHAVRFPRDERTVTP